MQVAGMAHDKHWKAHSITIRGCTHKGEKDTNWSTDDRTNVERL